MVVIDMQTDFTDFIDAKKGDPGYLAARISRVNAMAAEARTQKRPVINVRQIFDSGYASFLVRLLGGGRGASGSKGLGLDPRLHLDASADIVKHIGDAFSAPEFERFLAANHVGELVLTGLDGNYCVKNTAEGALNRGYKVLIAEDAVAVLDDRKWQAEKDRLEGLGVRFVTAHELAPSA